mgnify:CR=1 FL=1
MRIVRSVRHNLCADGSFMKEFLLSTSIPERFFAYLGTFGQVEALQNIGEGFYKFEKPDWFSVKGFIGDTTVEIRFKKEVMDLTVDFLYLLFTTSREGPIDHQVLKQREQAVKRVQEHFYGR